MAHGLADDLLSTVVLATRAPILVVPSMNTNMYNNPIVQDNLGRLRDRGFHILEPAEENWLVGLQVKDGCRKWMKFILRSRNCCFLAGIMRVKWF